MRLTNPIPSPFKTTSLKDYAPPVKETNPNVHQIAGQTYLRTETEDGSESELISPGKNRKATITAADHVQINQTPHLDLIKYTHIKSKWAIGWSAQKIVQSFNKRGYGKRTVDKYIAAINRAAKTPPLLKK